MLSKRPPWTTLELVIVYVLLTAIAWLALANDAAGLEGLNDTRRDPWVAQDKVGHFIAGTIVGGFGYLMADELRPDWPEWKKVAAGVATSAFVGVLKEVADSQDPKNHSASCKDALATVGGGALGSVSLSLVFRW